MMLGEIDGVVYKDNQMQLNPGDTLFIYTDGVPEACDADKKRFGSERMLEALNREKDLRPEELLPAVRREVDAFVGGADQFDDLTMLAIRYNGRSKME